MAYFFFSSRRRHTRWPRDWSSDVCSSDLIGKHLGFDVTWVGEEFLHVGLCTPERFHCFAACGVESFLDVIEVVYNLQATSATAICCLNRNWKAVLFGALPGFLPIIDGVRSTRRQRCADSFGAATG